MQAAHLRIGSEDKGACCRLVKCHQYCKQDSADQSQPPRKQCHLVMQKAIMRRASGDIEWLQSLKELGDSFSSSAIRSIKAVTVKCKKECDQMYPQLNVELSAASASCCWLCFPCGNACLSRMYRTLSVLLLVVGGTCPWVIRI